MRESHDPDGAVRLLLGGELDVAVADRLRDRLTEFKRAGVSVRLDLSQLSFIDSSRLRVVVMARAAARRNGWRFEIDPELTPSVRRPLELLGLTSYLWSSDERASA